MAKIGLSDDGLQTSLKEIDSSLKEVDRSIAATDKAINNAGKAGLETTQLWEQQYDLLKTQIETTAEKLQGLESAQSKVAEAYDNGAIDYSVYIEFQNEIANTATKLENLKKRAEEANAALHPSADTSTYQTINTSLDGVNQRYANSRKELEEVNKALKVSGDNAQLMAQKNTLLGEAIHDAQVKLQVLTSQQERMNEAVRSGDTTAEEYRAFQREIANTQAELAALTEEQKNLGKAAEETGNKSEKGLEKTTDALKKVEKVAMATTAAVTAALGKLSSDALSAYSQYEQMVGGIETLFAGAEDIVLENAQNAYKTAGISANSYMEIVTGFSATLLQGLSGDTQKAAEIADRALIDMSDNANKMGTAMGSIQYAYQGFAKQNYTMLDNLKLGYGGSQAEMARLINDSGVLNGQMVATAENVKEIPFDKVIEAIHVIQTNLGITGTTAKEAESTIEGSLNKLKASWENALVEIAEPLDDFAQGGLTVLNDNVDEIKEALVGTMEEIKPLLDEGLEKAKNWIESGGLKEFSEDVVGTVEFIIDNKETLLGIFAALEISLGAERMNKVIDSSKEIISAINGIGDAANTAVGGVDAMSMSLSGWVAVAAVTITTAMALKTAIDNAADRLGEHSEEVNALEERTAAINEQRKALEELSKTDTATAWRQADGGYKDTLVELAEISKRFEELKAKRESGGTVNENGGFTYFSDDEIKAMDDELMSLEIQKNALIALKREQSQILTQYNEQEIAVMEQHNAEKEDIIFKSGNTAEAAVASAWEHIRETTKAKMDELDDQLATHKIDDNTYWAQRKAYLEAHRDEESEEWWKYYDAVNDHYDKLSKTEKTAADKSAKEAETALKDSYSKRYEALKRQQKENGYDDQWLADELKKMLSEITEGSDLYNTYYDKWIDLTGKISDATEKATEKEVKEWKTSADKVANAVEKKYEQVQKAFEKAKSSYISALDLSASDKPEDDIYSRMGLARPKNGEEGADSQYDFSSENISKQTKELDEYTRNMEKLENSDIPEEYLENIRSMSFDKRKEYVKELLKLSPERLKKHYADISKYYRSAEKAGRSDTQSLKDDADKAALAAKGSIQKSLSELGSDAYESGKAAAEAYWKGFAEYKSDTEKLMGVTAAGNSKSAGITTPVNLTINVNGKQAATISTEEYLNQVKNQGGTLDV
jgi:phage-related minor tail protein